MKKLFLLLSILKLSISAAQLPILTTAILSKESADQSLFIGTDAFGYCYTIENNVFSKFNAKEKYSYQNIYLGKITKVDLINPLRIMVFYEDFNSVALLDNQLNETAIINFSEKSNSVMTAAVGMTSQNQLWIYNNLTQQIGLYNYLNNEFKPISVPLKSNFSYYQTDFNTFNWIDTDRNWYSCDRFGKIKLVTKVALFDKIQLINEHQFIYKKDNLLYFTEIISPEKSIETVISITEKTFENFYYKDQILAIFTASEKTNYKLILP